MMFFNKKATLVFINVDFGNDNQYRLHHQLKKCKDGNKGESFGSEYLDKGANKDVT